MPVYQYSKPTEKAQFGKPPTLGTNINAYNIKAIDVQTERRNFPGYGEAQYVTMADLVDNVQDTWGTTDTDSDGASDQGVTKINRKLSGKQKSRWK